MFNIFQFGMVKCEVCKEDFDLKSILNHLAKSKDCQSSYSKNSLEAIKAKCEEKNLFKDRNYQEEYYYHHTKRAIEEEKRKQKEKQKEKYREKCARQNDNYIEYKSKNLRSKNQVHFKCHLERIEKISWTDIADEIIDEISSMKQETKDTFTKLEDAINAAILAAEKERPQASIRISGKILTELAGNKQSKNIIFNTWRNIELKHGTRLQEIADEINQPFQCFFCPSKDRLCESCEEKYTVTQ